MIRVAFDDLDVSNDGYGDMLYRGEPFDGIATDVDSFGKCLLLMCYRWGKLNGPSREWDHDGRLMREKSSYMGGSHGPLREWDERGRLRLEEIGEHRVLVWRKRWDESGQLIEDQSHLTDSGAEALLRDRATWRILLLELEGDELVERAWPYDHLLPEEVRARLARETPLRP